MSRPDLGRRVTCPDCDTKYYTLNRPSPACPKCGTATPAEDDPLARRKRRRVAKPAVREETFEFDEEPEETEEDEEREEEEEEDEDDEVEELDLDDDKVPGRVGDEEDDAEEDEDPDIEELDDDDDLPDDELDLEGVEDDDVGGDDEEELVVTSDAEEPVVEDDEED